MISCMYLIGLNLIKSPNLIPAQFLFMVCAGFLLDAQCLNCAYSRIWPTILPHVLWWNAKLENTTFSRYCKAFMICLIWYTANIQFRPLGDPAWVYVTSWTNQLVGVLFIMSRISVNNVSLTRHFIRFASGWLSSFEELAYHKRYLLYFSMYILCQV